MDDDVKIPQDDQERIVAMVGQYRHQIENLYRMAYLQGAIDQNIEDGKKMKEALK